MEKLYKRGPNISSNKKIYLKTNTLLDIRLIKSTVEIHRKLDLIHVAARRTTCSIQRKTTFGRAVSSKAKIIHPSR